MGSSLMARDGLFKGTGLGIRDVYLIIASHVNIVVLFFSINQGDNGWEPTFLTNLLSTNLVLFQEREEGEMGAPFFFL